MDYKTTKNKSGSGESFNQNWKSRTEACYNHWTSSRPKNQIQLAFRQHWILFKEIIGDKKYDNCKCLEIGCGRGTISSYFAENNFDCTLMDISTSVLSIASNIFSFSGQKAKFICGDAEKMPFESNKFDVVVSIGLLEHFENVDTLIKEQFRVVKVDGIVLCYIVPENPDNVQKYFSWVNAIFRFFSFFGRSKVKTSTKASIFRNSYPPEFYLKLVKQKTAKNIDIIGMYPLPMISHSPSFPFTLLPKPLEIILTNIFKFVLMVREKMFNRNPWICEPKFGQAFLLIFRKNEN